LRSIVIFCQHFTPAFKGGGPIQSLSNLAEILKIDFKVFVFCSASDLGDHEPMSSITPNRWSEFSPGINVYYSTTSSLKVVARMLEDTNPDFVYINGLFSWRFNLIPLWLAHRSDLKIVISPRGMLQRGALSIKPIKKKIVLFLLKLSGLFNRIRWHVTDEQERMDVEKVIGLHHETVMASNIPKSLKPMDNRRVKRAGSATLVFLSLITEKKNLHLVLEALKYVQFPVRFHIYGPVKDEAYWIKCKKLMHDQIHEIMYFGPIKPDKVQEKLSEYHVMVLPTKGENFGHAIFESLGASTPALISHFTPWGNLQDFHAGITVEDFKPENWAAAIQKFIDFDQHAYSIYSNGAYRLAKSYFSKNDFRAQYQNLFS